MPLLGEPPSATQVAARLLILRQVYIIGDIAPRQEMLAEMQQELSPGEFVEAVVEMQQDMTECWGALQEPEIQAELSQKEIQLRQTPADMITHRQITDAFWRIESAQVLMWCLGLMDELPPYDTPADEANLRAPVFRSHRQLMDQVKLRPLIEMEKARDLAEIWHWRSRERELDEAKGRISEPSEWLDRALRRLEEAARSCAGDRVPEACLPQSSTGTSQRRERRIATSPMTNGARFNPSPSSATSP
ncbi:MAG TPA: DUF4272 domain-containing protein [Fimbriimonas sp.]|nr:DUF4272 domain-containing protein [Fimbriimonas sp.]